MSKPTEHPVTRALRVVHQAIKDGDIKAAEKLLANLRKNSTIEAPIEALEAWLAVRTEGVACAHVEQSPESSQTWKALSHSRWAIHREVERRRALEDGLKHSLDTRLLYHHIVDVHHAVRHYKGALHWASEGLLVHTHDPYLVKLRAQCSVATNHPDARQAILDHIEIDPDDWLRSWEMLLQIGAFDVAEALLNTAVEKHPTGPIQLSAVGRIALWAGDCERAVEIGNQVIGLAPNEPEGHFLVGAATTLEGGADAILHLRRAIDSTPRDETWFEVSAAFLFMAQNALQSDDHMAAIKFAQTARSKSFRFNATSVLVRTLATVVKGQKENLANSSRTSFSPSNRHCHGIELFQGITHGGPTDWREASPSFIEMANLLLKKLAGNRSSIPTMYDSSSLQLIRTPRLSAELARKVQLCIRILEPEAVKDQFEDLHTRFPESPTCYTYHGELLLWLGEYEASIEQFRRAIGRHHMTIWAWIGWAAALAMLGDHKGALAMLADGIKAADFEGPTVFVYRGEIYRRQGHFAKATEDLNIAVTSKPERISAWINRALLDHAMGDDRTCKILGRAIRRTNPGAWWDASAQVGTEPLSLSHAPQVLEALLDLMQGNRSSAIPTFVVQGCLRTIRWRVEDIPDQLKSLTV
mgnify:CR=1 FL=1